MKIVNPSFKIMDEIHPEKIIKSLESYARVCYKSESNITENSADNFVRQIIKKGHESVIEHEKITVKIICDRGVSHEIVRHRIASYSQESTRYCNYSNDKFGKELTFIKPIFWEEDSNIYNIWKNQMEMVEKDYIKMIEEGASPEQARSILPNSIKTEIVVTMNLREWRHFFKLRTSKRAHPQMREIAIPLFDVMCRLLPSIFDDLKIDEFLH